MLLTCAPVAVKVLLVCPAATVTLEGTVRLALLLESATAIALDAAPVNVTEQEDGTLIADRPETASWLSPKEREILNAMLAAERRERPKTSLVAALAMARHCFSPNGATMAQMAHSWP